MPHIRAEDEMFKAAARMLREMAAILEQRPEDVISIDHTVSMDCLPLTDKTFNISIQTRNIQGSNTYGK